MSVWRLIIKYDSTWFSLIATSSAWELVDKYSHTYNFLGSTTEAGYDLVTSFLTPARYWSPHSESRILASSSAPLASSSAALPACSTPRQSGQSGEESGESRPGLLLERERERGFSSWGVLRKGPSQLHTLNFQLISNEWAQKRHKHLPLFLKRHLSPVNE